jgi:hypothetical protein
MTAANRPTPAGLGSIHIDLQAIAAALKDRRLAVPVYQRSYTWQDDNVRDLLQDITTSLDEAEPEYFLGSIVAADGSTGRQEIVDGQQRLATTTILIAAIRDYLLATTDLDTALDIERDFLVQTDLRTRELHPRLQLNDFDNDFFLKRVLSRPGSPDRSTPPLRDSHRRIAAAANIAAQHIAALAQASSRPRDRILDLFQFIQERAKVIWVAVPDHANAFVIFETLNDRGLDLAISDLLKNYLFLMAEDRLTEVQQSWTSMLGVLATGLPTTVLLERGSSIPRSSAQLRQSSLQSTLLLNSSAVLNCTRPS